MKKMKQILCAICALCMLAVMFTGCGNSNNEIDSSPVVDDMSVHYEIKIGTWDCASWGNDAIADYLEKKFNVTIVPVALSTVDYIEKLNSSAAGDTLPDMFMHPGFSGYESTLIKWAEEEVIRALPDDLSAYPEIAALMQDYEFMKLEDGKHYFIPRTTFTDPANTYYTPALWVRRDWMNNLGIEDPQNMDELYDMLYKFTYNDPDGNGQKDTFGLTPGLDLSWVFYAYGIDVNGYIYEDGQWIHGMLSKRCAEPLKFIKKLYDNGILDQDFATISLSDSENTFCSGNAGMVYLVGESSPMQYVALAKLDATLDGFDYNKDLDILPPVSAEGYQYTCTQNYNFAQGTMFNSNLSSGKFARCLTLYNYLLSEEGVELGRFGIEGISYDMVDGERVSTLPKYSDGSEKWIGDAYPTSQITTLARWDCDGAWVSSDIEPRFVELAQKVRDLYGPCMNEKNPEIDFKSTPTKNKWNVNTYFWENVYQIIMEESNIDQAWENLRSELLNNKKGQQLINELNQ